MGNKRRRTLNRPKPAKATTLKLADQLFLEHGNTAYHRAIDMWVSLISVGYYAEASKYKSAADCLSHLGGVRWEEKKDGENETTD